MKYKRTLNGDLCEYLVTEGTAYFGFIVSGGCGFRVDEVKTGDSWWEGVGEELVVVAESEEKAWMHIINQYIRPNFNRNNKQ